MLLTSKLIKWTVFFVWFFDSKLDKIFFSDRIRVNGVRPKKKSQIVNEKDEIDIILRYNVKNPEFLDVNRVEILKLEGYSREEGEDSDDEAKMPAVLKRSKNLTIENYPTPFRGNLSEEWRLLRTFMSKNYPRLIFMICTHWKLIIT